VDGSGKAKIEFIDGGTTYSATSTTTVTDNAWHYVAGTYDGETSRLYINGKEVGSKHLGIAINSGGNLTQINQWPTSSGMAAITLPSMARSGMWSATCAA